MLIGCWCRRCTEARDRVHAIGIVKLGGAETSASVATGSSGAGAAGCSSVADAIARPTSS
jgi:hypothetical protein